MESEKASKERWYRRAMNKCMAFYQYCAHGVWDDTRKSTWVNIIKTLNITVKSFLSTDIQTQACAMTYRTMLAIVPVLALLFAIGRGFGLQTLLQDELYHIFPSQREAISKALVFVDSYLNQASEGIFVGVGIVFLLYTIINLVSSVEAAFNLIWDVREGRTFWRKITDYTAMLLILPVLMICGSGLNMFLSKTVMQIFHFSFMTPVIKVWFEVASFLFMCLFFTAAFVMIPNTKVNIKNALLAGFFTDTGFMVLQWLFVTGQLYVAKYNAIYGSFSFLPLFLLWMQLVWVICLSGALICYASQNIFQFSFSDQISDISRDYREKITIAIAAVIVQRFVKRQSPVTDQELIITYGIPSRLVTDITNRLCVAKIVSRVLIDEKHQLTGYQPAVSPDLITLNYIRQRLNQMGYCDFVPNFDQNFPGVIESINDINAMIVSQAKDIKLDDIQINKPIKDKINKSNKDKRLNKSIKDNHHD